MQTSRRVLFGTLTALGFFVFGGEACGGPVGFQSEGGSDVASASDSAPEDAAIDVAPASPAGQDGSTTDANSSADGGDAKDDGPLLCPTDYDAVEGSIVPPPRPCDSGPPPPH